MSRFTAISEELMHLRVEQLREIRSKIDHLIENDNARRETALSAIRNKAQELGFELEELLPSAPRSRRVVGARAPASDTLFVHPDDPELTWSGKGRHPKWFKQLIRSGIDPESLIKPRN